MKKHTIDLSQLVNFHGRAMCRDNWRIQDMYLKVFLNKSGFKNASDINTINYLSCHDSHPEILFNVKTVDVVRVANHLNGGIKYNNSPLIAYNSLGVEPSHVDISLIQCFYGTDEFLEKAVKFALTIMSMSNPRPEEWIFVEAQKNEKDAKFKWVSQIGMKYIFKRIWNENQNYFIKEQLWNIGASISNNSKLVFVDADVAYCQTDWLKFVNNTFKCGTHLFQPHAWSWRASEPNGEKDEYVDSLNILESFGHRRKLGKSLAEFGGHTGYDIAITRKHYNAIHGFYSLLGTGGDFFMWSLLGKDEKELPDRHPFKNLIQEIEQSEKIPHENIGCSDLVCFHNYHGSSDKRKNQYQTDLDEIRNSQYPELYIVNNFNSQEIGEKKTWEEK